MIEDGVIELSHKVRKETEFFKLETKLVEALDHHRDDVWYISSEVTFSTHIGTHIEAPYHHLKEGMKVADLSINKLIGNCVVLDFTHKKDKEAILLKDIEKFDAQVRKDDIVFIRTDMDTLYGTPRWQEGPYMSEDAIRWLIRKQIACFGSDAWNMETPGTDFQPIHTALFEAGIPMIESLRNLGSIMGGGFEVFILPLPILGLDASPIRAIAIRKDRLKNL